MIPSFPPVELRPLIEEIGKLLKENGQTVSVAETAAGGIISACLLSIPGASGFYKGGLTLYTLESRIAFAGWTEETLKGYKWVSFLCVFSVCINSSHFDSGPTPEVVSGLAKNVREKLQSTYTICESGTAGPTGNPALRNRTPGYVALAIASHDAVVTREVETGLFDREANMVAFSAAALTLLRDILKGSQSFDAGRS